MNSTVLAIASKTVVSDMFPVSQSTSTTVAFTIKIFRAFSEIAFAIPVNVEATKVRPHKKNAIAMHDDVFVIL